MEQKKQLLEYQFLLFPFLQTLSCTRFCSDAKKVSKWFSALPSRWRTMKRKLISNEKNNKNLIPSLKLTFSSLKIGRNPKGKVCLPTIHFQVRSPVSFREGNTSTSNEKNTFPPPPPPPRVGFHFLKPTKATPTFPWGVEEFAGEV